MAATTIETMTNPRDSLPNVYTNITAREKDFVTRFARNWKSLSEILGIVRPIKKDAGTQLVSYTASVTLEDGDVDPGCVIPYSKATVAKANYADLKIEKYAKAVPVEDVDKYGAEIAVTKTDDAFLNELQTVVLDRFYTQLTDSTYAMTGQENTFQMAVAIAIGKVIDKFKRMRRDVSSVVVFVNTMDLYRYLGGADVTIQTMFGLQYIKDFLGAQTVILSSEIESGKVIAIPSDNMVLYYVDPSSEFSKLGLVYTVEGQTNLLGFHVEGKYDTAVGASFALMGMTLWCEYADAVAIIEIDDSFLTDLTLGAESQGTTIYSTLVSNLQGNDVTVVNGRVTGTIKYYDTPGEIVDYWGPGYFFAFKISNEAQATTKTLVGLEPSDGTGFVNIHGDAQMNGIAKLSETHPQRFKTIQSDAAGHRNIQEWDLSGLTLAPKEG